MSDINLDFTVNNNSIQFTVEPNEITITPTDIQLQINTGGSLTAGGSNTQLQYNNQQLLDGIPTATYDGSNLSLGNVGNIKITGGVNGYVLQTDGTGNLDWTAMSGGGGNGTPGGANTQIQYNDNGLFGGNTGFTFNEITGNVGIPGNLIVVGNISGIVNNVGTLTNLSVTGNANIGNVFANTLRTSDDKIILGNGAGANTAITGQGVAIGYYAGYTNQGDDAIAIGDAAGQTNQGNSSIAIGGGAGYVGQGNNSIILNATGTQYSPTTANALFIKPIRNANTANALFYDSSTGEIVFDTAVTANYVAFAGNVVNNSQPNITSLGTLTNLSVSGNITTSRLISNIATGTAPFVVTSTTQVANLSVAAAGTANTVTTAAQPNITSVGTLTSLAVTGTATAGNVYANSGTVGASLLTGTLTTAAQPNITSIGTLANLSVTNNITAGNVYANTGNIGANLLIGTLTTSLQPNITRLGSLPFSTTNSIDTSGISGTYNYDILSGSIQNIGALSGNIIVNLRGNSTTTFANLVPLGSGMECTFCCYNNSGNSFSLTDVYIDGSDGDISVHGYPSIPYTPATGTFLYYKIVVSRIALTGTKYEAWVTSLPMTGAA